MADVVTKANLFPETLVTDLFNKVKGTSSLAKLSNQTPIPFNGLKEFTFTLDKEIDVVAENGKKTKGGVTVEPVTIVPVKIEYGARVSDEFLYASEEAKLSILQSFAEGFAKKVARAIDIMAFHGLNPRTKEASSVIGNNCFDKKVNQIVTEDTNTADQDIESAIELVQGSQGDVTGIVLSPMLRSNLAKLTDGQNRRLYPELAWGSNPGVINGLNCDVNTTVSFGDTHKDSAIVGDFATAFKWGYAKEIPLEVIQYGNPDNDESLGDLKGHNQVYLRAEAYIGWGILDANSFAIIKTK